MASREDRRLSSFVEKVVARRRDIMSTVRSIPRLVRNAVRAALGKADYERWNAPGGLEEWWDERTQLVAAMVPAPSTVIEFGAGRRALERFLPPTCAYIPSDLSDRGPGTLVCDLNVRPLPDLRPLAPDVAVFSGVLEYIKDVDAIVAWLTENGIRTCVLSFDAFPSALNWAARVRERRRRTYYGYMNNLTEPELKRIFQDRGLVCVEERRWTHQGLYRFTTAGTHGTSRARVQLNP